jgi:hypothetical protein
MGQPQRSVVYPGLGNACNGCGLCCLAEQCDVSLDLFGTQEVCPALLLKEGKYNCDLVSHPKRYVYRVPIEQIWRWMPPVGHEFPEVVQAHFKLVFGIGFGCDAEFEQEEDDRLLSLD